MRVYLDRCIYNRPFDDYHKSERVFIEAMVFYTLLHLVENGQIELVSSDALLYENDRTTDIERKTRVRSYLDRAIGFVELSDEIIERAKAIESLGFKSIDALHISMAERGTSEYFVTCDDAIIKKAKAVHDRLKVRVLGVLEFSLEVLYAKNIERN